MATTSGRRRQMEPWRRAEQRQRSVLAVVLLVVVLAIGFAMLYGVRAVGQAFAPESSASGFYTDRVVVVGVEHATALTEVDRNVLDDAAAEAGAVLTGGHCPAAGWASLSAMHQVEVACEIEVTDLGVVNDWRDRQAEAEQTGGELGALAGSGGNCITAVGPGAALAAARPDGTTAEYLTAESFIEGGFASNCPLTLVDAGPLSSEVISELAAAEDVTVIVTGIGGDTSAQPIYRLATTLPGWLTSETTGRTGVVTLPDLAVTLSGFLAAGEPAATPYAHPLEVIDRPAGVSADRLDEQVTRATRLVAVPGTALIVVAAGMAVIAAAGVVLWWQGSGRVRKLAIPVLATITASLPPALLLAGATAWWRSATPGVSLAIAVVVSWLILAGSTWASRWIGPLARRGLTGWQMLATLTFLLCLLDAALDGVLRRNSLLAVRPMTQFSGFDGSVMALLVTAAVAVVAALVLGAKKSEPSKKKPLPYEQLSRPILGVAVLGATVLAVVWTARTPTVLDVAGFAAVMIWYGGATAWLRHAGGAVGRG